MRIYCLPRVQARQGCHRRHGPFFGHLCLGRASSCRVSHRQCPWASLAWRYPLLSDAAKSDLQVAVGGQVIIAVGGAELAAMAAPTASAQHLIGRGGGPRGIPRWGRAVIIFLVRVLAPFPQVATHVIDAIGTHAFREAAYRLGELLQGLQA